MRMRGQILHNLLGNAAKFTWTGFVGLHVSLDPARNLLLIAVSDRCLLPTPTPRRVSALPMRRDRR
jgi:CubicO group peptidase (beta-lactamase class C family)